MKIEIVRKVMVVGIAMLIGIAVCVSVWFLLREHKAMEFQGQNRSTRSNNEIATDNQTTPQLSQKSAGNPNEESLTTKERVTRQASSMFMSSLSEEQLATPFAQKMLNAMNSPEYLDLMESDFTIRQWNNFLESQGVTVTREHPGLFRKVVPHMELEDYEPVIRRKLAELFIDAEPVDLTNPVAAAQQRGRVYLELAAADKANMAWFIEKFGEDRDGFFRSKDIEGNPAFIWLSGVQRNATSIVKAAEAAGGDVPESQTTAPSWDLSSVMESPSVSSDATMGESPSISPPATDALARPDIPQPETDAAATPAPGLTDVPKALTELPTVEGLETILKSQFSSERFERAMDTLERYGSEEGLRRLRETDPEVAKQVENSQRGEEVSQ